MGLVHIVLFGFKKTTTPEQIDDVSLRDLLYGLYIYSTLLQACKRMLALGEKCVHPTSQKPYVKFITGGVNNSPEGLAVS